MSRFRKAEKRQRFLRMALVGPSGSGKTYTSLLVGSHIGKRIALLDTERSSASLYSDRFDFEVASLTSFHPRRYVEAFRDAAAEGFDVLVIDSLSHAWMGKDGILDMADKKGGNFGAWRSLTPEHNALVDALLDFPGHVIATMRSKTDYLVDKDEKGKQSVTKVGLAPVQRDGMEYEFDVVGALDHNHVFHVSKSRCFELQDEIIRRPGEEMAKTLARWLAVDGAAPAPAPAPIRRPAPPPPPSEPRPNSPADLGFAPPSPSPEERRLQALARAEEAIRGASTIVQLEELIARFPAGPPAGLVPVIAAKRAELEVLASPFSRIAVAIRAAADDEERQGLREELDEAAGDGRLDAREVGDLRALLAARAEARGRIVVEAVTAKSRAELDALEQRRLDALAAGTISEVEGARAAEAISRRCAHLAEKARREGAPARDEGDAA